MFNFLGADFLAPKSSHRREKQPVLGPERAFPVVHENISPRPYCSSQPIPLLYFTGSINPPLLLWKEGYSRS